MMGRKGQRIAANLKKPVVSIGVMGSCSGVGTTHFAIMLAGFLSSKEHRKTALIELNRADTFSVLKKLSCEEDLYDYYSDGNFNLNGVDYYPKQTETGFSGVFQKDYEYIIFDLGCEWDRNINEFLRCSISCFVGSLSEWKLSTFEECTCKLKNLTDNESVYYLTVFGMHKFKKNIEKKYHIRINTVPFEPTPFLLHRETFAFFEQLLS